MRADWFTRMGDSQELHVTLCDDNGTAVNLDGYTVELRLTGPRVSTTGCRVTNSRAGEIICVPRFAIPGSYRGRFRIRNAAGVSVSYPTNRDFTVTVLGAP